MRAAKKLLSMIVLFLAVIILVFSLAGCNGSTVTEGVVVDKYYGEPLLFSVGNLKMTDPSKPAMVFCLTVMAESGETAKFYVTEQVYRTYAVGDWFVYDSAFDI